MEDKEDQEAVEEEKVETKSDVTEAADTETTTIMSGMKKAVLDLYALSQGTQKMLGEEEEVRIHSFPVLNKSNLFGTP